jgi:hypothetical protein
VQFIDKKTEKLVFDRGGTVVAINKGLTKKEKEAGRLDSQAKRRWIRVEQKRVLMKLGVIPERALDSDVDGLSSLEAPDEEYGTRNYNPNQVAESMRREREQHLWELHAKISELPVSAQHQKWRTQAYLEYYDRAKAGELKDLKFVDEEGETTRILKRYAAQSAQRGSRKALAQGLGPDEAIGRQYAGSQMLLQKR